jgi:hypothetical protein
MRKFVYTALFVIRFYAGCWAGYLLDVSKDASMRFGLWAEKEDLSTLKEIWLEVTEDFFDELAAIDFVWGRWF